MQLTKIKTASQQSSMVEGASWYGLASLPQSLENLSSRRRKWIPKFTNTSSKMTLRCLLLRSLESQKSQNSFMNMQLRPANCWTTSDTGQQRPITSHKFKKNSCTATDPLEISMVFKQFYMSLCSSDGDPSPDFSNLNIPQIDPSAA